MNTFGEKYIVASIEDIGTIQLELYSLINQTTDQSLSDALHHRLRETRQLLRLGTKHNVHYPSRFYVATKRDHHLPNNGQDDLDSAFKVLIRNGWDNVDRLRAIPVFQTLVRTYLLSNGRDVEALQLYKDAIDVWQQKGLLNSRTLAPADGSKKEYYFNRQVKFAKELIHNVFYPTG